MQSLYGFSKMEFSDEYLQSCKGNKVLDWNQTELMYDGYIWEWKEYCWIQDIPKQGL